MHVGMLWFITDKKASLEESVKVAAKYYKDKYGIYPNTCCVNPKSYSSDSVEMNIKFDNHNILVKPLRSILFNHLWIGVEDKTENNEK